MAELPRGQGEQTPTHRCAASREGSYCPAQMPQLIFFIFSDSLMPDNLSHIPLEGKTHARNLFCQGEKMELHHIFIASDKNTPPSRPASSQQITLPYPLPSSGKKCSELDGFRRWL